MANEIKLGHKRPMGPKQNEMVHPRHISLSKEERENVGDLVGFIHLKPPPQTLTQMNHVSIVTFMGMMWIIVSFLHSKL